MSSATGRGHGLRRQAQLGGAEGRGARRRGPRPAATAHSVLDGVALGLPALTRAEKLQNRAARVGFDWPNVGASRSLRRSTRSSLS